MNGWADSIVSAFPTVLLWAGTSLMAMLMLARLAKRRRESLTDALKKHVERNLGPPPDAAAEAKPK